jgi:hypothetical protein
MGDEIAFLNAFCPGDSGEMLPMFSIKNGIFRADY